MAKKVILKDQDNVEILPITRGELIVDSSGKEAFHSNEFLATNSQPGLMSPEEKAKISTIAGNTIDSTLSTTSVNPVQNKVVTGAINEAKQLANDAQETANDASENVSKVQQILNSIKESYLKSATVDGNVLTIVDQSDSEITFTNTTYNTFLKETAANTGGRNGLVPKPNYNDGSKTRFLREDGTWVIPTNSNTTYTFANGTSGNFTVTPSGGTAQTVSIGKPATAGTADAAVKLQTKRKLWGQDFDGTTDVSGNMTSVGNINMTGDIDIKIADSDKFVIFDYDGNKTAGASWRIGALGTGSGNTNYFVIESGTSDTTNTAWTKVMQLGMNNYDATFAGQLTATKFIGNLNHTLTFSAGAFTAKTYNNSAAVTVNIPTHTSHLTNDSGFLTSRGYIGTTAVQASSASQSLTGIADVTMSGSINNVLKATTSQNAALLNVSEITANINYIHLYVSSLNSSATNTRALVLQNGYGNVGIGTSDPTQKLHVAGLVNITANSGTLTIGCQNSSWTHYSTTGGTHWFNKSVEVNGDLTPHANNSFTLGTSSKRWSTIYGVNGNFSGTIFVNTGDPTLKIYSGKITDGKSDGNICFQTCIDGQDGQSHSYAVDYQARNNIVLQPRGGQVYIGTNPDGGNTGYKLYVNGNIFSTGFVKSGSSDSYVLLGGGGHKALSDFAMASAYVKKAGDTMTGRLTMTGEGIIVTTATSSNYRVGVEFYKGTTEDATYSYDAQIGWHNTGGDGTGSICILPYATSTQPWGGTVGLFITKTDLKYNNQTILHSGNSSVSGGGSSVGSSLTVKINGTSATLTIPSNVTSATKVLINQHTANNTEYPIVWSNSNNTTNAVNTDLFKSYNHLLYNPSAHRITTGQYVANNSAGPHFTANSTTGSWAYLRLHNGSTYWDIATRSDSGSGGLWLARLSGGDNGIFVSTGNNVGISTSSPSYKLHAAGDIYATGWSRAGSGFYIEGTGVHYTSQGGVGEINITSNNEFVYSTSNGTLYFNYRGASRGTTVTNYIWNAGSSSSYASHTLGALTSRGVQTLYGRTDTCNIGNTSSGSYTEAAAQIREYNFGGSQTDTWGNAPRLTWHWSGRVAAQIGLASNGYLYTAPLTATNWYKLVYESGTWAINISGNANYATSAGNADTVDGYHAGSFGIWRGNIQTDPEADDTTYTTTASFLSQLHSRSSVFNSNFSAFRGSWYYAGNVNYNTGVGTLEMAGTAVLNISGNTSNDVNYKTLLFIDRTGYLYSYVSQKSGVATWSRYAKTSEIPTVTNYYWANVKVSASSSTSTYPTFANMKSTGRIYAGEWIEFSGNTGLYWPNSHNQSHLYPNNTSSYGNLKILGNKGGYTGIHLGASTSYMTVMSTDTHHGLYCENTGIWEFYYNRSNSGVGIRTSTITKNFNVSGQSYLSSNTWIGTTTGSEMLNVGGWVGTVGNTGWYSITHAGGMYMEDSTWIRAYNNKKIYVANTDSTAFYTSGGMTALGHMYSQTVGSSWLDGQRYNNAAFNITNSPERDSYSPWIRQTLEIGKWVSIGTLQNSLYFIGSTTSRTANSYDYGFRMDFSNGYLYGNFSGYLSGTAYTASAIADSNNGTRITASYASGGFSSSPSWLAAWNGYHLTYVSPSVLSVNYASSAGSVAWANVTGKPTIPTVYSRNIGVNGTNWTFYSSTNAATTSIYAPTSAGTSGYILQSSGGTPTWTARQDYSNPGILWVGYIYRSSRSSTSYYASKSGGKATFSLTSTPNSSYEYLSGTLSGHTSIMAAFVQTQAVFSNSTTTCYAYSSINFGKGQEAGFDTYRVSISGSTVYIRACRMTDANNSSWEDDGFLATGSGHDDDARPVARLYLMIIGY